MFNLIRYSNKHYMIKVLLAAFAVIFYCEYLIHYVVLMQCKWPVLEIDKFDPRINAPNADETPVSAMFLSDIHLMGSIQGHWLDRPLRDRQIHRTFQAAMDIHKPDVVFVLGDTFNEGEWCTEEEFASYIDRFHSIFSVPENTLLYVVAGNHDIGFHRTITPYLNHRFVHGMKSPNVERVSIRGNHFVLINSMAFEGDGCSLCKPAEDAVNNISKQLKCAKGIEFDCNENSKIRRYSRPILLQHFPLYRESDEICHEVDEAPSNIKADKFKERWDCLSKEATEQLLDILDPRLVVDGHTHHSCRTIHRKDILEVTVPSFTWRIKSKTSFLLGIFTPNNFAVSKCYMPVENTIILIYVLSTIGILIYLYYRAKKRVFRVSMISLPYYSSLTNRYDY